MHSSVLLLLLVCVNAVLLTTETTFAASLDYYKCKGTTNPFNARLCCIKFGIACIPEGALCSTGGGFILPPPCAKGLTCVIFDFGFPPVDRPNVGRCRKLSSTPEKCSVGYCTANGAEAFCTVSDGIAGTSTCGAWAKRSDGFPGPDCNFVCIQICYPDGPYGSDGRKYCSGCHLASASCASHFRIYGPVPKPHHK